MAKLAALPKRAPAAPVRSAKGKRPDTLTHEGGAGFSREAKSELFLLAVTNMVSEKTFYESGKKRDARFADLVRAVAIEDPDWVARLVPYLRDVMNMRSAAVVMAAELVHAKLTRPVPDSKISNRAIISSALSRADEPAEMLGYWMSEWGKALPQPVKRGVADAVTRLYTERAVVKYDGGDQPIRFGDVVDLTHPTPKAPWQSALFDYALDSRHGREMDAARAELLPTIVANAAAMRLDDLAFRQAFDSALVESAGLTWEQASSRYGKLDARFWEAMIPSMGVFAIVRNLRNFSDVAVSAAAQDYVRAKLSDPETIAASRMLPLRFLAAHEATKSSLTYARELDLALELSLSSVPALKGRTLVLCDVSGSMDWAMSAKSDSTRIGAATVFAAALALRAESADLVAFSAGSQKIPHRAGGSVLLLAREVAGSMAHASTNTWSAVRENLAGHDRVVIVTDEQTQEDWRGDVAPEGTPLFTFNVAGYAPGHSPSGRKNRYTFGGLTDAGFAAIELIERDRDVAWPF
jgi:hypothetical protein